MVALRTTEGTTTSSPGDPTTLPSGTPSGTGSTLETTAENDAWIWSPSNLKTNMNGSSKEWEVCSKNLFLIKSR